MGYRIAVVGATGNVGREMLNILDEREFPVDEIVALASRRSLGTECAFGDRTLKSQDLDTFDFTGFDMALFAVGSEATTRTARPLRWWWPSSLSMIGRPSSGLWCPPISLFRAAVRMQWMSCGSRPRGCMCPVRRRIPRSSPSRSLSM